MRNETKEFLKQPAVLAMIFSCWCSVWIVGVFFFVVSVNAKLSDLNSQKVSGTHTNYCQNNDNK